MRGRTTKYCTNGPALVGGDGWFPSDPCDADWGDEVHQPGCNRLACTRCLGAVQNWVGWDYFGIPAPGALKALADDRAPGKLPGARFDRESRLYACHCSVAATSVYRRVSGGLTDDLKPLPWRCGGHPRVSPSGVHHGVDLYVPPARAVDQAIAAPPLAKVPIERQNPLAHLVGLLGDTPVAAALSVEVAGRLDDADPIQVRFAWSFFRCLPRAPGAERCGPSLRRRVGWLARVADPVEDGRPLLDGAVAACLARAAPREADGRVADRDALEGLWDAILMGADPTLLRQVAPLEPTLAVTRAQCFLASWPASLNLLVEAIESRDGLAPALRRWAIDDPSRRAEIRRHAASLGPADRRQLAALDDDG